MLVEPEFKKHVHMVSCYRDINNRLPELTPPTHSSQLESHLAKKDWLAGVSERSGADFSMNTAMESLKIDTDSGAGPAILAYVISFPPFGRWIRVITSDHLISFFFLFFVVPTINAICGLN